MKPTGLLLLLSAGMTVVCWAVEPAADSLPKVSAKLNEEIRSTLPKYVTPAAQPSGPDVTAAPPDPDVLRLPKMIIQEKRLPHSDPDVWLGERVVQQKAMAAYKGSMTDLEWALNCWFIPLFSAPPSVRARAAYESSKAAAEIGRLNNIINTIGLTDPKEAAKLRQAMDLTKLPKDN